jgi:branched-chain amino acid transport system ATP-binding protein
MFPRLAERRRNGGGQLSGGEQQMLAVGRALLLNGSLVIMDEPSEGLAPTIVDTLIDVVHRLVAEGVAVLVVEQNLRAATRMADRQLVMVSGRIQAETSAAELIANPELQQRYLGVEGVGRLDKEMK